ncbi:MAG: flagellar hook-basal body protein [Spirochaetales bacterium]|uniref:Flagellar hook-basal body protein n=1 Tax=Candidatus Thalassospirochaeta sargassi TaxID=3119039 RepID=A0AAJ1ICW6_9SPIO|nr:flagellar hook-basal body protein [Spirochaetales bacterium]
MLRGLYTGASGMQAQIHKMDALSNNLANVDTTGYKKDTSVQKAFPQMLIRRMNDEVYKYPFGSVDTTPVVGKLGSGVELNEIYTQFDQGSLKESGNPFDIALDGKGFFTVDTPTGERYTRNGTFMIDNNGLLVTKEGLPVQGENGNIYLKLNNFVLDKQGQIWQNADLADDPERLVSMKENDWENLELVDTLKIVDFTRDRYLKKQGSSMWMETDESGAPKSVALGSNTKTIQGFLEKANVNPVTEMVAMISVNRAYEANQKVITTQDELTDTLINRAVRV